MASLCEPLKVEQRAFGSIFARLRLTRLLLVEVGLHPGALHHAPRAMVPGFNLL